MPASIVPADLDTAILQPTEIRRNGGGQQRENWCLVCSWRGLTGDRGRGAMVDDPSTFAFITGQAP